MITRYRLRREVHDYILRHLVNVEESYKQMTDEWFRGNPGERDEYRNLMRRYIDSLHALMCASENSGAEGDSIPFVMVGSVVLLEDAETGETMLARVVWPFRDEKTHHEVVDVSCISPLGRAALMARRDSLIEVVAPIGTRSYYVKAICLSDHAVA